MPRRVTPPQPEVDPSEGDRRWRKLSRAEFVDPRLYALGGKPADPGSAALVKAVRERAEALEAGDGTTLDRLAALERFLAELGVLDEAMAYLERHPGGGAGR